MDKQSTQGKWSARCDCYKGHSSASGRCNHRDVTDPTASQARNLLPREWHAACSVYTAEAHAAPLNREDTMEATTHRFAGQPNLGQRVSVRFNGSSYYGTITAINGRSQTGRNAGRVRVEVEIVTGARTRQLIRHYYGFPFGVRHACRLSKADRAEMAPDGAYMMSTPGEPMSRADALHAVTEAPPTVGAVTSTKGPLSKSTRPDGSKVYTVADLARLTIHGGGTGELRIKTNGLDGWQSERWAHFAASAERRAAKIRKRIEKIAGITR